MKLDFTLNKYQELCDAISKSGYTALTVEKYLAEGDVPKKFIILRHDVDEEPEHALKMAKLENEFNIHSTYYFRYTKEVFRPNIIKTIHSLGHEIGYHYEVLSKSNGNYEHAYKTFENELNQFKSLCSITTIAQHGSPLLGELSATSFSGVYNIIKNFLNHKKVFTNLIEADLWKKYDFKKSGILGEAYTSINFNNIFYISDSGRDWNNAYRIKDIVPDTNPLFSKIKVNNTDDIINIVDKQKIDRIYILVHADQWRDNYIEWLNWYTLQYVRNIVKFALKLYSARSGKSDI